MKKISSMLAVLLCVVAVVMCFAACNVQKEPKTFTVTMPENPVGYTVSGEKTATEGKDYEFTVRIAQGYEKSADFAVKVNGTVVAEANGKYTVTNITEDLTITVDGVSKTLAVFTVTMPENPVGYTVSGEKTATEGKDYEFTVSVAQGYEKSADFAVKVNGTVVAEANGKYTVTNVTEDLTITVDGVSKTLAVFTVTMPENPVGYTVSGEKTATESKNYEFTVQFADGYKAGEDFAVTVNGKPVTATEGKYVVENVNKNLVIEVEGVVEVSLKATFVAEGFEKALKNKDDQFAYSVEFFTFKIELADHYTQCADTIEVYYTFDGGEETMVTANDEGVYKINNPHKDVSIIVKNVAKNLYKVTFYRNAVQKYVIEQVVAESVLTDEQINTAKAAVVNDNETFVAWREDISAPIVDNTVFSAYTTSNKAFGEVIEGCALADGTEKTLGEGEYSAAGGYKKIYTKAGLTTNGFAAIDVSGYTEVRFAFSISNSWLLLKGWNYYVTEVNAWYEVTMTNLLTGKWQVVVVGSVNHNEESGSEVLATAEFTLEGSTLNEIFKDLEGDNRADSITVVQVTELRGRKAEKYGEVVAEVPATDFVEVTDKKAPVDFEKAFYQENPTEKKFAAVDISKYSEIKFYLLLANSYTLIEGWGAYVENSNLGSDWVPVTLVNNGGNSWTITVAGHLSGSSVTDTTKYSYNASGSTLKDVLDSWFGYCGDNTKVYLTEIRGIKKVIEIKGEVIEGGVLTANTTENTTMEAAQGFEKVYAVEGTFDQSVKSTTDLSKYSEVMFAFKSGEYFLIDGWSIYLKDGYTDWAYVTMINNGDNSWTVTVLGDIYAGKVENPWTKTYSGNSIATILADWYNGANIYLSELRGVLAPVSEESATAPSAVWGEQVASSAMENTTETDFVVPNGYEAVTVFTKKAEVI